jgi:hypothetical protein
MASQEDIQIAVEEEYGRLKALGSEVLLQMTLAELVWEVGRRLYIRGASDKVREQRIAERQAAQPQQAGSPPSSPPFHRAEFRDGMLIIDGDPIIPEGRPRSTV